jgi:hypothetical protein
MNQEATDRVSIQTLFVKGHAVDALFQLLPCAPCSTEIGWYITPMLFLLRF